MTRNKTLPSHTRKRTDAIVERLRPTPSLEAIGRLQFPELQLPDLRLGGWVAAMEELSASMARAMQPYNDLLQRVSRALEPYRDVFAALTVEAAKCRRLEKAGWLPHSTTPFGELEDDMEPCEVSAIMERHYRDNWTQVCEVFLTDLDGYDMDEEAKAAFREALHVHGHGCYRASCRLLFPEMERVSRAEIYEGALEGVTSQRRLGQKIGKLTPCEMGTGLRGMALYRKFVDHIYAPVRSEDALRDVLSDPVPNRHVALHGLSAYATFQCSLNLIIICDFVFRAISTLKRFEEAESSEAA